MTQILVPTEDLIIANWETFPEVNNAPYYNLLQDGDDETGIRGTVEGTIQYLARVEFTDDPIEINGTYLLSVRMRKLPTERQVFGAFGIQQFQAPAYWDRVELTDELETYTVLFSLQGAAGLVNFEDLRFSIMGQTPFESAPIFGEVLRPDKDIEIGTWTSLEITKVTSVPPSGFHNQVALNAYDEFLLGTNELWESLSDDSTIVGEPGVGPYVKHRTFGVSSFTVGIKKSDTDFGDTLARIGIVGIGYPGTWMKYDVTLIRFEKNSSTEIEHGPFTIQPSSGIQPFARLVFISSFPNTSSPAMQLPNGTDYSKLRIKVDNVRTSYFSEGFGTRTLATNITVPGGDFDNLQEAQQPVIETFNTSAVSGSEVPLPKFVGKPTNGDIIGRNTGLDITIPASSRFITFIVYVDGESEEIRSGFPPHPIIGFGTPGAVGIIVTSPLTGETLANGGGVLPAAWTDENASNPRIASGGFIFGVHANFPSRAVDETFPGGVIELDVKVQVSPGAYITREPLSPTGDLVARRPGISVPRIDIILPPSALDVQGITVTLNGEIAFPDMEITEMFFEMPKREWVGKLSKESNAEPR